MLNKLLLLLLLLLLLFIDVTPKILHFYDKFHFQNTTLGQHATS